MRRFFALILKSTGLLAAVITTVLLVPVDTAESLGTEMCSVEILVDGRPLSEYHARGTTYIEALNGREYAIRLKNHSDRRLAVALAVDGLNSIDARTSDARSASK